MFLPKPLNTRTPESRYLIPFVLGLGLTASMNAQQPSASVSASGGGAAAPVPATKNAMYIGGGHMLGVVTPDHLMDVKVITGAPYSATITTTLTQTLADGTHIVQKQEAFSARDSAGRTRREESLSNIGPWSTSNSNPIVFINDPVAQTHYVLQPDGKTAMKMSLPTGTTTITPAGALPPMTEQKTFIFVGQPGETLSREALPALPTPPPPGAKDTLAAPTSDVAGAGPHVVTSVMVNGEETAAQDKVQTLADQTIEGVLAHGSQITTTIPAGAIGNDQPILVTTETWYSPDLQMVVLSKRNDPRVGESVMAVTNIQRGEPGAALFQVPAGYTVTDGGAPMLKIRTDNPPPVQ
jgi:hypothetical protein